MSARMQHQTLREECLNKMEVEASERVLVNTKLEVYADFLKSYQDLHQE